MSERKSRIRVIVEIVVAVVVLAAVFIWSESLFSDKVGPDTKPATRSPHARGGATATAVELELSVETEALGTVRPIREATVSARVMGLVRRVAVEEGAKVAAGELLIELEAEEIIARAEAAARRVEAAQVDLGQARRDRERMLALEAREAATRVEAEHAETRFALAQAALSTAREAAAGERAAAGYATLRAPFAGRVIERLVEPGDLASPGRALLRLEAEGGSRLEVPLDERLASGLAVGDGVKLRFDPSPQLVEAVIGELEPEADPATHTVMVKIDLPAGLEPASGAFGRATFRTGTRRGLVVPAEALRRLGGLVTLRVVMEDGRTIRRHVRLGAELPDGRVEVLSGLRAGDRIALEGPEEAR